jgi:K+-sensing histidine kinase KdpD
LRSAEDLISDLLDISRLENGKINPDRKPFAVNELFDILGAEFKALAQEQGLKFRVRGSHLRIDSDSKLLRRILQNFLTNAFPLRQGAGVAGRAPASTANCAWRCGIAGRGFRKINSR